MGFDTHRTKVTGGGLSSSEPAHRHHSCSVRRQSLSVITVGRLGRSHREAAPPDAHDRRKSGRAKDRGYDVFPGTNQTGFQSMASQHNFLSMIKASRCFRNQPQAALLNLYFDETGLWCGWCALPILRSAAFPPRIDYSDYRVVAGVKNTIPLDCGRGPTVRSPSKLTESAAECCDRRIEVRQTRSSSSPQNDFSKM